MQSLMITTLGKPKKLMISFVLATVLFAPRTIHAQQLQKGVSVQMAVTSNATPMPEADNPDAWIVTITSDGSLYLGTHPVSPPDNLYYRHEESFV